MALDTDTLKTFYEQMLLVRRFEEKAAQLYGQEKIHGFCHLYIGQEAVAVGAIGALNADDYVITTYRDHAHPLILGTDPKKVLAELYGKATGVSSGKGGSMHMFDIERGFYGGHGIVGAHVPLATGMAFASKYKGDGKVTVCFLGDAAVNQGAFHEALNMAGLWDLPLVILVENNIYGMGTHYKRATAGVMSEKGKAYGMVSEEVDGMDLVGFHERMVEAVRLAREESKPTFLEVKCYRFRGHSMSDPGKYRTKEEVQAEQARDPLTTTKALLEEQGVEAEWFKAANKDAKAQVAEAVKFAEESPWPELGELYTDVIVESGPE